jgi:hypothetical protein
MERADVNDDDWRWNLKSGALLKGEIFVFVIMTASMENLQVELAKNMVKLVVFEYMHYSIVDCFEVIRI